MLNIKILGPGCYNCHQLERITVMTLDGYGAVRNSLDIWSSHQ